MGCSSCGGSFWGHATNVAKAAVSGQQVLVSDDVRVERLVQCAGCEQLQRYQPGAALGDDVTMGDKCLQCGCYVKPKAAFATEVCPMGKWGVVDGETESN